MKAIILDKYGSFDTLKYEDIEKPVPKDNEVLIKIYASSVNFNILGLVKGKPFMARLWSGLLKPKIRIPGNDISGQVEAVGRNVTRLHPGDKVFGDIFEHGFGAFAEYVAVPENAPALKPSNLTFEEAGAVPESALVALHALRDRGHIQNGQKVLIYGASGGIGTFAVQIAKAFGAEVTGVCSTKNLDLVHSLGADHVIDYTKDDFVKVGQQYDLIVSIAGYRSIFDYRRALSPAGIYVCIGGAMTGPKAMMQIFQALLLGQIVSITGKKKLGILSLIPSSQKDLDLIRELIESGKVRPVIDRRFPLKQTVEALKYYEGRHSRGKIVIVIEHSD